MTALVQETPQLQFALHYARMGWSVVPAHRAIKQQDGSTICTCREGPACISKGKHPAIGWTEYQKRCASEHEIRNWFTGYFAEYGIGIITGAVSGFFVVDVDTGPGKPGLDNISDLQFINGDLPHTVEARTGGGGRHILLRHPGPEVWIATNKNTPAPGVDIRGDGGFIVAAPSLHESGRFYLWDEHHHPKNTPIADAPEWLIEMVRGVPADGAASGPRAPSTGTGEIIRDQWGKVTDGRERHMIGIICGVIASLTRDAGALPIAEAVFAEAWPTYERTTRARGESLEADHRGPSLMRQRIGHMLRRAQMGKWRVEARHEPQPEPVHYDPETGEIIPPEAVPDLCATPLAELDLDNIPPRRWVYGYELVRGFVSVLASPGGTGKTAYTMAVVASVALKRPLLHGATGPAPAHCKTHVQGRVWLYNLEDPMDEMRRRIKATLQHYRIGKAEVGDRIYINSGRDRPLIIARRAENGDLIAAPIVDDLVKEIKRRGIDVIVIDPFVQSHSAEENRNEEMNLVMSLWGMVAHRAHCAVWLVHHFRKGGKSGDAESIRGAGAIQGAARSMHTMSTMTTEEASKLGVQDDQRGQYVRHDNAKQNMAPPAAHATWYRLASVPLNNGDAEYPDGDYVQAVEAWSPPSPWEGMPWSMIERVLNAIDSGPGGGEFYALGKQARDRWAGHVLVSEAALTEGQAATILKTWKDNGVLEDGQYASPRQKGGTTGCIRVNQAKAAEMRLAFRTKENPVDE
jgi:hypothetical protein